MDFKKRSGSFTSDGKDYIITKISPFNKISVLNYTQAAATGSGVYFLYYKGMEDGGGIIITKSLPSKAPIGLNDDQVSANTDNEEQRAFNLLADLDFWCFRNECNGWIWIYYN